jgi:hypothetical protein
MMAVGMAVPVVMAMRVAVPVIMVVVVVVVGMGHREPMSHRARAGSMLAAADQRFCPAGGG